MLIKSTQEMRAFLGRAISSDFTFDSLKPYLELAQQDYLVKALGAEYWAILEAQALNSEVNNPILPLVSRALAFYAYHKYLPYSIGLDSDNGLQETESDSTKPLRIGVLEKRQRETIENASNALESVLLELFKNKTTYQAFWATPYGISLKSVWFPTATHLTDVLPLVGGSYRMFVSINRYFVWAEVSKVLPVIGMATLTQIKQAHINNATDEVLVNACRLLKQYIAWAAYEEALLFLNVVQLGNGSLRVLSEFDGINNTKAPDEKLWAEYKRGIQNRTDGAYNDLIGFLSKNVATFSDFANQAAYKPERGRLPDNSKYKSIFRMK
ncbi:DUF6712 family protein [Cellulophaga sp. BC115SP]|uniref:DUF6712 family protein n=1 Tax=Cellulophaga sp. BC115SP TaxID=2683263 RepID=UPI001411E5AD|nr:DUF6712 family protein [Cellulophaga sp. BC115SP]NBB26770.1 hypothetical protein [Cellulophaga sp. BC115SP]